MEKVMDNGIYTKIAQTSFMVEQNTSVMLDPLCFTAIQSNFIK